MSSEPQTQSRTPPVTSASSSSSTTAERMIFEKGYRGVSIRDLASAVGFQAFFPLLLLPSKEDILHRIISRYMERLLAAANGAIERAGPGASATEKARLLIRESVISLIQRRRLAAGITVSQGAPLPARSSSAEPQRRDRSPATSACMRTLS